MMQRLRPSFILLRCLSVLCLLAHLCAGGFIGIDDSTWETIRRQGCNVGCYSLGKLLIPMCRAFCNNDGKIDEDQVRLVKDCDNFLNNAISTIKAADADTPKDPSPFRRRQFNDAPITSDQAGTPENIEGPPMARCNTYLPQNPDNANFKVGQTGRLQQRQLQVNPNNPGMVPLGSGGGNGFCPNKITKPAEKALRRREVVKTLSGFKKCMPLVSAGPFSDPYHSALTGIPRADVVRRLGTGMAYSLTNKGVNCPKGGSPCIWSQSTSVTVTNAISFAISRGNTVTYTKTNATNWNDGSTDSTTDILSKATEDSVTRTFASTNSSSFSKNLQDTFTKSLDITRGNTTANSNEQSWTNQLTWNREDSKTQTISNGYEYTALGGNQYNLNVGASRDSVSQKSADNSMTVTCTKTRGWDEGVNLEISKGAASAGYTATISDQNARSVTFTISQGAMKSKSVRNDCSQSVTENNGENYAVRHNCDNTHTVAYSHGGSKAYTHGHTNTFTDELRQTDSTSNAYMSGNTTENGWAITNTDAYGYTTSNTYGTNVLKSKTYSSGKGYTDAYADSNSVEAINTTMYTIAQTIETSQSIPIPPGTIGYVVCRPLVISEITPWSCIEESGDMIYTTEVQLPPTLEQSNNVTCIMEVEDPGAPQKVFKHAAQKYVNIPEQAALKFGYVMDLTLGTNTKKDRSNGVFTLKFEAENSCNIGVFRGAIREWSTGIMNGYPITSKSITCRLRVTTDGHLIQEAQGVYINAPSDWTVVWSTQPYGLDYPVGVFGSKGYTLVLQEDGELELLDGMDIRIWSNRLSKNRFGYKYPVMSIFPTVKPTESSDSGAKDYHNTLPSNIKWKGDRLILTIQNVTSETCNANFIESNQGIRSPNGRFSMYLDEGGNLFLKDGSRTMWQTQTMDMWFATPPYRAGLDTKGMFQVKDGGSKVIWSTENGGMTSMVITDNGTLFGLTDTIQKPTWTLRVDLNATFYGHMTYTRPYVSCDHCAKCTLVGKTAPIYNLATGVCIPISYTNSTCRSFKYVEATKHYIAMSETNTTVETGLCLGNATDILSACSPFTTWKHYNDYFLTMNHKTDTCLGTNFTLTSCTNDNLRGTKLWSHGPAITDSLRTDRNRLMFFGEKFQKDGASFKLGANGNLVLTNKKGTQPKQILSNMVFREKTVMELTVDGDLVVTNMWGNVTIQTVSGKRGTPPYVAGLQADGAFEIRDSKGFATYRFSA